MASETILLVGEGDFSFAASLLAEKDIEKFNVVATCYEQVGQSTVERQSNIDYILSRGGHVLQDVDATKLHEHHEIKQLKLTQIRFNFPHIDGKMNMKNNRRLLGQFFQSCFKLLSVTENYDAKVIVTLCAGQGGTPADGPFKRRWDDTWKIVQLAAEADFLLRETEPFNPENYAKYNCTGFRKQEKGFRLNGAIVHVFTLGKRVDISQFDLKLTLTSELSYKEPYSTCEERETLVQYPLETPHDISFWCCTENFDELSFTRCLRYFLGDILKETRLLEEYNDNSIEGVVRTSRCYRLIYQSKHLVLSKTMTNEIQNKLRHFLTKNVTNIVLR